MKKENNLIATIIILAVFCILGYWWNESLKYTNRFDQSQKIVDTVNIGGHRFIHLHYTNGDDGFYIHSQGCPIENDTLIPQPIIQTK